MALNGLIILKKSNETIKNDRIDNINSKINALFKPLCETLKR